MISIEDLPRIESKENQHVKQVKALRSKKERDETSRYLIEGVRLTEEAISACQEVHFALISSQLLEKERGLALVQACVDREIPTFLVKDVIFNNCADTEHSQGILLVASQRCYSWEELCASDCSLIMVADGISDPGNLGNIMRTALGAGANGIMLLPGCSDIYNPKVVRASMGTIFRLPFFELASAAEALSLLRQANLSVFVAAAEGKSIYCQEDLRQPLAWVMGSEAKGAEDFWREKADKIVSLPMTRGLESLNVSAAAAIFLYETARQRGFNNC